MEMILARPGSLESFRHASLKDGVSLPHAFAYRDSFRPCSRFRGFRSRGILEANEPRLLDAGRCMTAGRR